MSDKVAVLSTITQEEVIEEDLNYAKELQQSTDYVQPIKQPKSVSVKELFKYADSKDYWLMGFGSLAAILNGASQPIMTIVFSNLIYAFSEYRKGGEEVLEREVKKYSLLFVALAAYAFLVAYLQMSLWMLTGERQCKRMRELYLEALLRQDMAWYDTQSESMSRLSGDVNLVLDGISEKFGLGIQAYAQLLSGFIVSFIRGWRLSLVLLAMLPFIAGATAFMTFVIASGSAESQTAYAQAGKLAEEVLAGIKTVVSFGAEEGEIKRYEKELDRALGQGKKRAIVGGLGLGVVMFILYGAYGLAFWVGSRWVALGLMTGADVLNVVFAMIIGAMGIGSSAPNFTALAAAKGAGAKIFEVISRETRVVSSRGKTISNHISQLDFKNVSFSYPARPNVPVLTNFCLTIKAGQTVALVGESGSGKSTCIQLLERFYDPVHGKVLVDGTDIREVNLESLRGMIGMVGQEPILFGVSIYQNVAWGARDDQEISRELVEEACKIANAHEFILQLPQGYDTLVGERGSLLSGGQKQRIAIARAVVKNPQILLLDEATSALDSESEQKVQKALDRASRGRTTLVIAHRLSTIQHADLIVVMNKGEITETGTHEELIQIDGLYAKLVKAQRVHNDEKSNSTTKSKPYNEETLEEVVVGEEEEKEGGGEGPKELTPTVEATKSIPWKRLFELNAPEMWMGLVGIIGSLVEGSLFPSFSIAFAEILVIFGETDVVRLKNGADFWSLMFLLIASIAFLSSGIKTGMFAWYGETLSKRVRSLTFRTMLQQEVGFFDLPENGTGILTSRLATEADDIKGLSAVVVGAIMHAISALVVGLVIAFVHGWLLTLVILACVPLVGFAAQAEMSVLAGFSESTKRAYEDAAQLASEAVQNIRTVASMNRERSFLDDFKETIKEPHEKAIRGALLSSIGYGCSQALVFLVYSLAFYTGGKLVRSGEYNAGQMFTVLFSVIFGIIEASQVISMAPSITKAKNAAISFFHLLDREPLIRTGDQEVELKGNVTAEMVDFSYPSRPLFQVLKGLDLQLREGQKMAIVGASGSGKSTIISLIQRFYDVSRGSLKVENLALSGWNLQALRGQISLVGQEPVLFDRTIAENIALGSNVSQGMIEEAAKMANIDDFINRLPQGYETRVGMRGSLLSGGQKQRIAIARAMVRNPQILLLDEATSALDSESELIVQQALDRASRGRTTLVIAHRLSTIKDADVVVVFKDGRVVERGSHADLLQKEEGVYKTLVLRQTV